MMMEFNHIPVMLKQCINALEIKSDGIYLDCTLGGGGHSIEIVKRLTTGKLIAIDKDVQAIEYCKQKLIEYSNKMTFCHDDFKNADTILSDLNIDKIDGVLMDLGVSSWQLDNKERGFSYLGDFPLDMRMDTTSNLSAYDVVNDYTKQRLYEIIRDYGEDKFASNIAKNIVEARKIAPIKSTKQLADIVDKSIPMALKRTGGHPAKRTFQAIRIEVNGELENLECVVRALVDKLNPTGRMVILTFHSLEDRIIKQTFADLALDCVCPSNFPVCVCNHRAKVQLVNKKPIIVSEEELKLNTRSASAKLRAIEKLSNK